MVGQGVLVARKIGTLAAENPRQEFEALDGLDSVDKSGSVHWLISFKSVDRLLIPLADLSLAEVFTNMGHPIPSEEMSTGLATEKAVDMIVVEAKSPQDWRVSELISISLVNIDSSHSRGRSE